MPHDRLGEEVAAVVMLREGTSADEQELLDHVSARLASFKVPTRLRISDEPLPRNAAGKFLKRELRRSELEAAGVAEA
jgi:long-chain acyl-CoA synthetase